MSELKEIIIVCDRCGDEARFSLHRDDVELVGGVEAARRQSGDHPTSFYGSRADYCSYCVGQGAAR